MTAEGRSLHIKISSAFVELWRGHTAQLNVGDAAERKDGNAAPLSFTLHTARKGVSVDIGTFFCGIKSEIHFLLAFDPDK